MNTHKQVLSPEKLRIKNILDATADFDAPSPPKPPPPLFVPPCTLDRVHNPTRQEWNQILPDLAVLDGVVEHMSDADNQALRFVTKLEITLYRRQTRKHRTQYPLPVASPDYKVIRYDGRSRFMAVRYPETFDFAYITTAPYPEWLTDGSVRDALADILMEESGL